MQKKELKRIQHKNKREREKEQKGKERKKPKQKHRNSNKEYGSARDVLIWFVDMKTYENNNIIIIEIMYIHYGAIAAEIERGNQTSQLILAVDI